MRHHKLFQFYNVVVCPAYMQQMSVKKTDADTETGEPTVMKIAETFCLMILFDIFFKNWIWTRDWVIGAATSDMLWDPAACLERKEWVGFLQVNITLSHANSGAISSTVLHHGQYWNSKSPGSLTHQPFLEFFNPTVSWLSETENKSTNLLSSSAYMQDLGTVWEPNRWDSHLKNNSFSFTLQWTNWKK